MQKVNTVTTNLGADVRVDFEERPALPDRLADIVYERNRMPDAGGSPA